MFKRIVEFGPAWDRRDPTPSKNYGIHGVELRMYLKGPKGAIQFVLYTNWHLPEVQEELDRKFLARPDSVGLRVRAPMPADLGYHSPVPLWEGQEPMSRECHVLGPGVTCYYDGSSLNAERIYEVLLREGSEGVWKELEEEYHSRFDEVEVPMQLPLTGDGGE